MPNATPIAKPDATPEIPAEIKIRGKVALSSLAAESDKEVTHVAKPSQPEAPVRPAVPPAVAPATKVHWKTRQKQERESAIAPKVKAKTKATALTVPVTVRKEDKHGNVTNTICNLPVDPTYPYRGFTVEQIREVHATTYPDAPPYDPMLGDVTPAFRAWLKVNQPGAYAIRYFERPE